MGVNEAATSHAWSSTSSESIPVITTDGQVQRVPQALAGRRRAGSRMMPLPIGFIASTPIPSSTSRGSTSRSKLR